MVNYRRNLVPGGTYFFTVALHNRSARYLVDYNDLLLESFNNANTKQPFTTIAQVVLPDHLHVIWGLPDNDVAYPNRWRAIKSQFSRSILKAGVPLVRNSRGEYSLWQKRYWEHTIRDEQDLQRHIDYIHYNPVKHGYAKNVVDWPYSSFHRYVDENILTKDWGSDSANFKDVKFGE